MSQATLTERPYVNSGLFSTHYLDERLPDTDEWDCDDRAREAMEEIQSLYALEGDLVPGYKEDALIDDWIDEVLDILGFGTQAEVTLPEADGYVDSLLFETPKKRREAAQVYLDTQDTTDLFERGIGLLEAKQWDADFSQRFSEQRPYYNASQQIKRYLGKTPANIQWGILTNGRKWRLYGTNEYEEQIYYEVDLPQLLEQGGVEEFKYFYLFFRPEALRKSGSESFLDEVWAESETASQELGEDLQDNVFTALRVLGRGFVESNNTLDIDPNDDEALDELKDQSLVLLYRLMFVLYAESRNLIHPDNPAAVDEYEANFSLDELRLDIHDQIGEVDEGFEGEFSNHSTTMWSRIEDLSRLIDEGEEALGIPPYNGGLFNSDSHTFLANHEISNRYLAEVIYRLSTTQNDEGRYVLADYGDLDTRHLGSVYEGLLEHQFKIADEEMAAVAVDGGQVWKLATDVSVSESVDQVPQGELYVVNDQGERKSTGAYYTPNYVVTYIVEETVAPLVDDIRDDLVDQGFERGTQEYLGPFLQRITDLKILDPAMGSGHFLTKATGYLSQQVMEEVRDVETEMGVAFDEQHIRREIAKECIYGVDINGMAVELAKLSMWLETLAADRPLAFLDHHLKTGNSLVGSDITEVLSDDNDEDNDGQLTLTQAFARVRQDTLEHVMGLMSDLLAYDNETLEDVKSMEDLYDSIREDQLYQRLFEIANVYTAEQFGVDVPEGSYEQMAGAIEDEEDWKEIRGEDWFTAAQVTAEGQKFFHWELEFPEVFFDQDGELSEYSGFDGVVGNPPYVKIQELRQTVPELADFLGTRYRSAGGNYDLYVCFTEKGYELTSESGFLGYIEPHKFFQSSFGEGLRGYLSENNALHKVISFGDYQVFEDATIYTCILLLSKENSNQFEYGKASGDLLTEDAISSHWIDKDYTQEPWNFHPPQISDLLSKLKAAGTPLEKTAEKVFQGIATSADAVYMLEPIEQVDDSLIRVRKDGTEYTLESDLLKPLLKGSDSDRYAPVEPRLKVIFPYEIETEEGEKSASFVGVDEMESKYPRLYSYLQEHESELRARENGKMDHERWYDYVYPKNLTDYEREYIIAPRLGSQPEFTFKKGGVYHNTDIEGIPISSTIDISEKYLLSLLNSSVFWFFLTNTSSTFRGGYYTFRSEYLYPFSVILGDNDERIDNHKEIQTAISVGSLNHDLSKIAQIGPKTIAGKFGTAEMVLSGLVDSMMSTKSLRSELNLSLVDHLGNYESGSDLSDIGILQPSGESGTFLQKTSKDYPNLRTGSIRVHRKSANTVLIEATARYKPEDEDAYETDQWGYTETEYLPAFRITDLTEREADLIEYFVPVAVEEAGGFANFRETATKTNSLIDRLKAMELPDVDDVADDLENYIETVERAEELDEKIERIDDLIDKIVYELYGLTDEEIEIVEEAVSGD